MVVYSYFKLAPVHTGRFSEGGWACLLVYTELTVGRAVVTVCANSVIFGMQWEGVLASCRWPSHSNLC